jgi:hypothetical protein
MTEIQDQHPYRRPGRTPPPPRPPLPSPIWVTPVPGSPLAQSLAMLTTAEAELADAKARVTELQDRVKAETVGAAIASLGLGPGAIPPPNIRIAGSPGWLPRRLTWHGGDIMFDRTAFDADYPGLAELYWRYKKAHWTMEAQK